MRSKTLSQLQMYSLLREKKDELNLHELGFITTVLRDNELDDQLHDYYQAVLKLIGKQLN